MATLIHTDAAPAAIGPYAQAVVEDGWLYTSGAIPLDRDGQVVPGGIDAQTRQVFANLKAILAAAGADLSQVVKTTVFVTDLAHFAAINTVYGEAFGDHTPARSTVQVAALPRGVGVEIEAVVKL